MQELGYRKVELPKSLSAKFQNEKDHEYMRKFIIGILEKRFGFHKGFLAKKKVEVVLSNADILSGMHKVIKKVEARIPKNNPLELFLNTCEKECQNYLRRLQADGRLKQPQDQSLTEVKAVLEFVCDAVRPHAYWEEK